LTKIDKLDIQDLDAVASECAQRAVESGALKSAPDSPVVLVVSGFRNETQNDDPTISALTYLLIDKFNTIGKAHAMLDDPVVRERLKTNFLLGKGPRSPDYMLGGSVAQFRTQEGRTQQSTFIFHLKLTDTHIGEIVWQGEHQVTKQGT